VTTQTEKETWKKMRAMIEAYKKVQKENILSNLDDYFGECLEWAIRYWRIGHESVDNENVGIAIGVAQSLLMVQDEMGSWDVQMDLEAAIRAEIGRGVAN
jgi:hypothetical protein